MDLAAGVTFPTASLVKKKKKIHGVCFHDCCHDSEDCITLTNTMFQVIILTQTIIIITITTVLSHHKACSFWVFEITATRGSILENAPMGHSGV